MARQMDIAEKLMEKIGEQPVSFRKLCRSSKLNPRTVKTYLELIEFIQNESLVQTKRNGFRLLINKKRVKRHEN